MKTLDPLKLYFTQADIDEFNQHKDDLDDWAKQGRRELRPLIFQRFLQRIEERVKLADELLAEKHDFSVDETMIIEPDDAVFARNDAEVRDLWRSRVKYDLLGLMAEKAKAKAAEDRKAEDAKGRRGQTGRRGQRRPALALPMNRRLREADRRQSRPTTSRTPQEKLSRRYHSLLKRWHQTDNDELLEMYLTALTTSYDPHTSYMSPDSLNDFEIQMRLNLDGIGAALQGDSDGDTVIQKIIPGGAADKDRRLKPKTTRCSASARATTARSSTWST